MDLRNALSDLGEKVLLHTKNIGTEEATKNALITPFLHILGYDTGNPLEVVPEFTADNFPEKKGGRADYAVMRDGKPLFFMECKHWSEDLTKHKNQLKRYFASRHETKFGILTNGVQYLFFTDLGTPNVMDADPFLEIDLINLHKSDETQSLTHFHKDFFSEENILRKARQSNQKLLLKRAFAREVEDPSQAFLSHFASQIGMGNLSESESQSFKPILQEAMQEFLAEFALGQALEPKKKVEKPKAEIVTTREELEAYEIVRSIVGEEIDPERVSFKDTATYFSVTVDNKSTNHICRFYLSEKKKRIETRIDLESLTDIYSYKGLLLEQVRKFKE